MPDGGAPNGVRLTLATKQIMDDPRYIRAALPWIAHVRPCWGAPDNESAALHF